jgi:hypothetical protein
MKKGGDNGRILSVVVLTDGADTESAMSLEQLMPRVQFDGETKTIHVFTIAYGSDARKDVLKQISDATRPTATKARLRTSSASSRTFRRSFRKPHGLEL